MFPAVMALAGCGRAADGKTGPTFHRDIAPIVLEHCAACHRPDGSGPFSLLTYAEVKDRGPQIAKVTRSHFMPPWLPDSKPHEFLGDHRLTQAQIDTIQQWVAAGSVEGNPIDSPPRPEWPAGWQLGQPDLIVELSKTYTLPPEGTDVWRGFVFAVPITAPRFVRAIEIQPGSKKIVHHATFYIDSTSAARRLDGKDSQPGYPGMDQPRGVQTPEGHFVSWLPGEDPVEYDADMAWRLEPGTDLVLGVHMLPSGKPESIRPRIGLYFTDVPPSKFPVDLGLQSQYIDIPAGTKGFEATASYTLPVDVKLFGLHPHAHLLADEFEVWAALPDGTRQPLLRIPHWDFNWQNIYRYAAPIALPKGTTITMRVRFDNSAANVRNPNRPPRRVTFGLRSSDEMAQLDLQVLPRNLDDNRALNADYQGYDLKSMIGWREFRLKLRPDDSDLHAELGTDLVLSGRTAEGLDHLRRAVELDPHNADAHYHLGHFELERGELNAARREYEAAIKADPDCYLALAELGLWHLQKGELSQAQLLLERSLKIHPRDAVVLNNLGIALFRDHDRDAALANFRAALRVDPNYSEAQENLHKIKALPPP